MPWVAALLTLATGVLMPTLDVYTDIFFAINVCMFEATDDCYGFLGYGQHEAYHKYYATAMLIPPFISWLFVAYHWFKNEMSVKDKVKTLPILIMQGYPQWRALRVLYYGRWKKQREWQRMKQDWETEIGNLGLTRQNTAE